MSVCIGDTSYIFIIRPQLVKVFVEEMWLQFDCTKHLVNEEICV